MSKRYRTRKPMQIGAMFHPPGSIVALAQWDAKWAATIGAIDPEPVADDAQPTVQPTPVQRAVAPAGRGCAGCGWR